MRPERDADRKRLQGAVEFSYKRLEKYRQVRRELNAQHAGNYYSDDGPQEAVAINLHELMITTYTRMLVAQNPAVLLRSRNPVYRRTCIAFELALNKLFQEIDFADSMRKFVRAGMVGLPVMKVGIEIHDLEVDGVMHTIGNPYADVVDLDDWVHDVSAKSWESAAFMGNRYRLPYEYVMDSGLYDNTKDLQPTQKEEFSEEGGDKNETISRGQPGQPGDEYQDYIELWDIWLPQEGKFCTFDTDFNKLIREVDWTGPARGPYHVMCFNTVDGQIMPVSPLSLVHSLHKLYNGVFNRQAQRARNLKQVLGYTGVAQADAERIVNAEDLETLKLQHSDGLVKMSFNSLDPQALSFLSLVQMLHNRQSGNIDALAGMGMQGNTLGQEEIIQANASGRPQDMQSQVYKVTERIVRDLGWYLFTDPTVKVETMRRIEKTNIEVPYEFSRNTIQGGFSDYEIEVIPYSMQQTPPAAKMADLDNWVMSFVLPALPMLIQQGYKFSFEKYLKTRARYKNMPEIEEFFSLEDQGHGQAQGQGQEVRQSPVTRRENVRVNRSGMTAPGQSQVMMQEFASMAGSQNKEMERL